MKCPKCGSKMMLRTARRGYNIGNQFYGCSNYPRCDGFALSNTTPDKCYFKDFSKRNDNQWPNGPDTSSTCEPNRPNFDYYEKPPMRIRTKMGDFDGI